MQRDTTSRSYIALYDFDATEHGQLSIKVGDIVKVGEEQLKGKRDGWVKASVHGNQGLVPENYIERMNDGIRRLTSGRSEQKEGGPWIVSAVDPDTEDPDDYEEPVSNVSDITYQVIFKYDARTRQEIDLKYGDIIEVNLATQQGVDKGWMYGSVNGRSGLFPEAYTVQVAPPEDDYITLIADPPDCNVELAKRRQKSIDQLFDAVTSFSHYLEETKKVFFDAILVKRTPIEDDWRRVSENWKILIKHCKNLYSALKTNLKAAPGDPPIGDTLFLQLNQLMKVTQYVEWDKDAEVIIQKSGGSLQALFSGIFSLSSTMDVRAQIIEQIQTVFRAPVEHIIIYPDLIRKILENTTSTHCDYKRLQEAFVKAVKVCEQIDERSQEMKDMDQMRRLRDIVKGVNFTFTSNTDCAGPRKLIFSTLVTEIQTGQETPSVLFLLNDFLVLANYKPTKGLQAEGYMRTDTKITFQISRPPMPINKVEVMRKSGLDPNLLHLIYLEGYVYTIINLRTPTATDRQMWTTKIAETSKEYSEAKQTTFGTSNKRDAETSSMTYTARKKFTTDDPDALDLSPGDVIKVGGHQKGADPGWVFGSCQGRTGWVPSRYIHLPTHDFRRSQLEGRISKNPVANIDASKALPEVPDCGRRPSLNSDNKILKRNSIPTRMPGSHLPPRIPPRRREAKDLHQ